MLNPDRQVGEAIKLFWLTRDKQSERQGEKSGTKDAGLRAAVTGGKHLDGFRDICRKLFAQAGVPDAHIYWEKKKDVPGYYRAEKDWDLVVVADGNLLAMIEFKAQVGPSFGNNMNNRAEEAIGNATDLWAAYREGAFKPSPRPWLGYVFILEDCPKSRNPVKVKQSHFKAFEEFIGASYAKRYEILLTRLLRERLYDGSCLILTTRKDGPKGKYTTPTPELSFRSFAAGLYAARHRLCKIQQVADYNDLKRDSLRCARFFRESVPSALYRYIRDQCDSGCCNAQPAAALT